MDTSGIRWRAIATCVIALAVARCSPPAPRAIDIRPIRITVLDSRTGRPLADVPVWFAIQTVVTRGKVFGILPAIEPDIGPKLALAEQRETDRLGHVSFGARSLLLPGNERLDTEYAFVNLAGKLDHPAARSLLEGRRSGRREHPQLYGDVPDDVYVAWFVRHHGDEREVYRHPRPSHRGALLISIPGEGGAGYVDWTRPGDPFRVQWNFSSLQRPSDDVVVALEPAPAPRR
jgi:hypothetical protein